MKKILVSVSSAVLAFSSFSLNAEEDSIDIGELILDKAKSAVLGQFQSLLVDSIFGSSGQNYVTLSEQSLQDIQYRINQELVAQAEYEFIAAFNSLEDSMEHYSDTVQNGSTDTTLLSNLVIEANDLANHHALNSGFNSDYYYMADSFALASSLILSVYSERYLTGSINLTNLKATASNLASKLDSMVEDKKDADWPLSSQCERSDPYSQVVETTCRLYDPHGNTIVTFVYDPRDSYDRQYWYTLKDQKSDEYYEKHIGRLEDIVIDLENF